MDRVRFGRALGFGARQAMKTLVNAVDAATAENPRPSPNQPPRHAAPSPPAGRSPTAIPTPVAAKAPAQTPSQPPQLKKRLGRGTKRFGEAAWEPFVRLSGVLWLEVTGSFFGLFALVALGYLWKLRAQWHPASADPSARHSLIGAAIMFILFGYFSISSFLRAHRRQRRR